MLWRLGLNTRVLPGLVVAPVLLAPANFCLFVPAFSKRAPGLSLCPFLFQMHVRWMGRGDFSWLVNCLPPLLLTLTIPWAALCYFQMLSSPSSWRHMVITAKPLASVTVQNGAVCMPRLETGRQRRDIKIGEVYLWLSCHFSA